MSRSGPSSARAPDTLPSSWPRCTPSAPQARASDGSSLTMKSTPAAAAASAQARASASSVSGESERSRIWTMSTPAAARAGMCCARRPAARWAGATR